MNPLPFIKSDSTEIPRDVGEKLGELFYLILFDDEMKLFKGTLGQFVTER